MSYPIEKGVPMPSRGPKRKYTFTQIEIGDSFFGDENAAFAARMYARKHKKKFAARRNGKGMRIWRTA